MISGMTTSPRLSLDSFKQIFRDHFEEFLRQYPEYGWAREVVEKMLGCGDQAQGYSEYLCPRCSERKVVAFS